MRKKETPNPSRVRGRGVEVSETLFYACNEPKSVLARDLGDCRDNLRNSRSVFLIVDLNLIKSNQKIKKYD